MMSHKTNTKDFKMKHLILLLTVVSLAGCAAIDGRRLEKDIANYTKTVDTICTTAELFSTIGKPIPGVDECKQALKTAELIKSRSDAFAVADTLRCVEKNQDNLKSVEFVQCLSGVKWWPMVVDNINKKLEKW